MRGHIHLSGNPVPWDIDRGSSHQELFVMLHTKEPEYVNWAVRMDRKTLSITHITAGPLLRNRDYRNEVGPSASLSRVDVPCQSHLVANNSPALAASNAILLEQGCLSCGRSVTFRMGLPFSAALLKLSRLFPFMCCHLPAARAASLLICIALNHRRLTCAHFVNSN